MLVEGSPESVNQGAYLRPMFYSAEKLHHVLTGQQR